MKKPPIFGIVVWKDIASSEDEKDFNLPLKFTVGKLQYHRKDKTFTVIAEDMLSEGFEQKGYCVKIPKTNVDLIIPLKIDLPEIPTDLSPELKELLEKNFGIASNVPINL